MIMPILPFRFLLAGRGLKEGPTCQPEASGCTPWVPLGWANSGRAYVIRGASESGPRRDRTKPLPCIEALIGLRKSGGDRRRLNRTRTARKTAMTDLKIFGEHDERTLAQMWRCMGVGSVAGGVLCADGHLGYAQPVGGVIAYEEHVSISGVGFDIGCGNMAARVNLKYDDIRERVPAIAGDIAKEVSFKD
jgi:hypothetical protein